MKTEKEIRERLTKDEQRLNEVKSHPLDDYYTSDDRKEDVIAYKERISVMNWILEEIR